VGGLLLILGEGEAEQKCSREKGVEIRFLTMLALI
jgi:hypothetical protein